MTKKINAAEEWITDRVAYLKGLQKPKEHQLMLIALTEKSKQSKLSAAEEKLLDAVIKVEKVEARLQAAMAHVAHVQNPQSPAQRALESRKKTIVGGYLLAHDPKMFDKIVSKLTRPQDRAVFNLPPLSSAEDGDARTPEAPGEQPAFVTSTIPERPAPSPSLAASQEQSGA